MAPFEITALACGTCHTSGIAAWRNENGAVREVIFVSATFVHDAAAAGAAPAFVCAACKQRAAVEPLQTRT